MSGLLATTAIAALKVGLPTAIISWLLFRRWFNDGVLQVSDDRKTIDANLQKAHKTLRAKKIDSSKGSGALANQLLEAKWLQFGGGFYGVAALWTLGVLELTGLVSWVGNFPGFDKLLENGFVNFMVSLLQNQIDTFVSAITWFRYWGEDRGDVAIWFVVAWLGYLLGMLLARRSRIQETSD